MTEDHWYKRGRIAAHNDCWMEPCYEEEIERGLTNLSKILFVHRERWTETDHFQHAYGQCMRDEVDIEIEDLEEYEPAGLGQYEQFWLRHRLYADKLDAFWEGWEDEIDAFTLIKEALERKSANT